jgi:hypothetical protein
MTFPVEGEEGGSVLNACRVWGLKSTEKGLIRKHYFRVARDPGTISLMCQSRTGGAHLVSRFENQFLRAPVQNFRDIEFVFRRTCYLVDPPELP